MILTFVVVHSYEQQKIILSAGKLEKLFFFLLMAYALSYESHILSQP